MNVYAMKQLPDRRTLRCECPLRRRRVRSRDDHLARPLALYACAGPRETPCIPSESIRSQAKLHQPPPKPTRFNLTSQFQVSFFFLLSNLYGGIPIPANISFVVFSLFAVNAFEELRKCLRLVCITLNFPSSIVE